MIRRLAVAFAVVSAAAATAFVGCGGSTNKGGGGSDGGPESSVPSDSSTGDASHKEASAGEGGGEGGSGLPEGGVAPQGTQLVTSQYAALAGVTTDGYAIYTDISAITLNAVSVAGGAPSDIGAEDAGITGSAGVYVAGNVV
ncbi:MAG: hypothetical protein ACRELB_13220, partial [Polyangiaceae bacterium]